MAFLVWRERGKWSIPADTTKYSIGYQRNQGADVEKSGHDAREVHEGLEYQRHSNRVWHRCPKLLDLLLRAWSGEQPTPATWEGMHPEDWTPSVQQSATRPKRKTRIVTVAKAWDKCLYPVVKVPIGVLRQETAYFCPSCKSVVDVETVKKSPMVRLVVENGHWSIKSLTKGIQ